MKRRSVTAVEREIVINRGGNRELSLVRVSAWVVLQRMDRPVRESEHSD